MEFGWSPEQTLSRGDQCIVGEAGREGASGMGRVANVLEAEVN